MGETCYLKSVISLLLRPLRNGIVYINKKNVAVFLICLAKRSENFLNSQKVGLDCKININSLLKYLPATKCSIDVRKVSFK